jgi:hypothetical protein
MTNLSRPKQFFLSIVGLTVFVFMFAVLGAATVFAAPDNSEKLRSHALENRLSYLDNRMLAQSVESLEVEPNNVREPPSGGGNPPGGGGNGGDGGDGGGGGGKQCDDGETLEKDFTNLGEENSCSSHKVGENQCSHPDDNGSQGWLTDTVPDCGETADYQEGGGCFKGGSGSDMNDCNGPAVIQDKEQTCSCVGDGGGGGDTTSPVCGGVSLSGDNNKLNVSASCNDGPDCSSDTSDYDSETATKSFSDPLPANSKVNVSVDMDINASNYDANASAKTRVKTFDGASRLDERVKEISVDVGPQSGNKNDSVEKNISLTTSEGVDEIEIYRNADVSVGPGGGSSGHNPTSANANNFAVDVSVQSPSCNEGPNASNDGPIDVDQCSDSGGREIDVLGNDSDPDNDSLEITSITSQPSEGSVSIIDGGDRVEYSPPSNYTGSVTFEYEASDGNGGTDTAEVTINVTDTGCNSSPDASDDGNNNAKICGGSGSPIDINVLNNDDANGGTLTIDSLTQPDNGSASVIQKNGTDWIQYTPGSNTGTVTFDYTVVDGNGGSATATVTVDVQTANAGCGQFRVRVENPNGNKVGADFQPKYDSDNDGNLELLPKRTGDHTYNVKVSDNPRLGQMNENHLDTGSIPDQYSQNVDRFDKTVEQTTNTGGNTVDEPDDRTYQNPDDRESKLATDIVPPNDPPTADFTYQKTDTNPPGIVVEFTDQSSDSDGTVDNYAWNFDHNSSLSTNENPSYEYPAIVSSYSVTLGVTDDDGATDSITKEVSISTSCDESTCSWDDQSCGAGSCSSGEMQQQYNCSDGDCSDGDTRCVADSSCTTPPSNSAPNCSQTLVEYEDPLSSPQSIDWSATAYATDPDGDSLSYSYTFDGQTGPGTGSCVPGSAIPVSETSDTLDGTVNDARSDDGKTVCNYTVTVSDGQASCSDSFKAQHDCGDTGDPSQCLGSSGPGFDGGTGGNDGNTGGNGGNNGGNEGFRDGGSSGNDTRTFDSL